MLSMNVPAHWHRPLTRASRDGVSWRNLGLVSVPCAHRYAAAPRLAFVGLGSGMTRWDRCHDPLGSLTDTASGSCTLSGGGL